MGDGRREEGPPIEGPPFYHPAFEDAYRYIIDCYEVEPREIAIFLPCAVHKPYSESPSHRLFSGVIGSALARDRYHIIIFGSCGILPGELETMYPFAHYRFMLGRVRDDTVREDFLRIETGRIAGYLEKTAGAYRTRVAYCIGLFREAMVAASGISGVPVQVYPSERNLKRMRFVLGCPFPDGSLSMEQYLNEFGTALREL
jgi:archaeosine synthase